MPKKISGPIISHCTKPYGSSLNFEPLKRWPAALPAIAYEGELLTNFGANFISGHSGHVYSVDASQVSFADAFLSCYPTLTLPELGRLYTAIQKAAHQAASDGFATISEKSCGLKESEALKTVLQKIVLTPLEFQTWAGARALATRELSILNSVVEMELVHPLLLEIARRELTRSQGSLALERGIELFLMGKSVAEILHNENSSAYSAEAWLKHLESLRRPQSAQRESRAQARVQALPWPAYAQAKWLRQGDQGSVEVKFQFFSSEDLKRKLEGLAKVQAAFEKEASL